jgi:hypothetical protein
MLKTLSVAALMTLMATASFAGSLNTEFEAEPQDEEVFVPVAGSGIGAPAIIGGVLAAVAIGALVSSDDDDVAATTTTD